MGKNIFDLPVEVITEILTQVSVTDLPNVSLSCKIFYQITNIESLWFKRCLTDFNLTAQSLTNIISYKRFYTQLLYKHGKLLGLWQLNFDPYGGLLRVHFDRGKLIGTEIMAPAEVCDPVRKSHLFMIELKEDGSSESKCLRKHYRANDHFASIERDADTLFSSTCNDVIAHRHPDGSDKDLTDWIKDETGKTNHEVSDIYEILLSKYLAFENCRLSYCFQKLNLRKYRPECCLIKPGLFKGTYGSHGIEFVYLSYNSSNNLARATKISGDPNIPYKKDSFMADLSSPLILTREEQGSIYSLMNVTPRSIDGLSFDELPTQPFIVPSNCVERQPKLPSLCQARFLAKGQVAGTGYINASFTKGHWVIFNEDCFGFLWLELLLLSTYHRVKDLTTP